MVEDDEFAEQIDTSPKHFEEETMEPHPRAVGKAGGCEDRFDEIEVNLPPLYHPAGEPLDEMVVEAGEPLDEVVVENNPGALVPPDEIEPDIIVENNPHVMESEEKSESAEECDSGEERNRTAREGQSGSQGALAGHKLDKEVRG